MNHSTDNIPFLDISISLKDGYLTTDLYTKPTDSHAYLPPTSCHPHHVTRNIPYSQFLRLKRLCSDNTTYHHRCDAMESWLSRRGYNKGTIRQARLRANTIKRSAALTYKTKTTTDRCPFILTYNPQNPPLRQWISELYNSVLSINNRTSQALPLPPIVGHRNPPNLRSILMPSALPTTTHVPPGCYKCESKRCVICKDHLVEGASVCSDQSGKCFDLMNSLSCNSANIIYLLYCDICKNAQYIGETKNALKNRFYLHRSDINKNTGSLVTKHFNQKNHSIHNMKCVAVEKVYGHGHSARLEREKVWMKRLQTVWPMGLNSND